MIMLLNLIIAVMTEGYESVKELANETWAYSQFLQIKTFEEKAARKREEAAAGLLRNAKEAGVKPLDTMNLNKIDADHFKKELHLLPLARESGHVYPVSSRIGILCSQWYFDAKKRNWNQERKGKRLEAHSGGTINTSESSTVSIQSLVADKMNSTAVNPLLS